MENLKQYNKSLNELNVKMPYKLIPDGTPIQIRIFNLYNCKLSEYTIGDIRFMILQNIGLEYLVPIAIEELKNNLFIESSYYSGDLLKTVLTVEKDFWLNFSKEKRDLALILNDFEQKLDTIYISKELKQKLKEIILEFQPT